MKKNYVTSMIANLALVVSLNATAGDDFKAQYQTSAASGVTLLAGATVLTVTNPGLVGATATSYGKFLLYYGVPVLVIFSSAMLVEKYKDRKSAKLEAQALIMNGGQIDQMSPALKDTVDEMRADINSAIENRELEPGVLKALDENPASVASISDAQIVLALANIN